MKGLIKIQYKQTRVIEGLNPVATYKVSPFHLNVFTKGQNNVIVFNMEMH